ncbi:MAG: hypothetical protein EOO63_14900, partial [Hymenobacter sp.]
MTSTNFSGPRTLLGALLVLTSCLAACNKQGGTEADADPTDTPTSGHVSISVDQTFAPILESQVDTFQKLYPDAHLKASYQPEDSVMLDLLNDKVKLAIISRDLNAKEKAELEK